MAQGQLKINSISNQYTLWVKKTGPLFTNYNFRNIEQIFTKFGTNQSLYILNIVPVYLNQLWKIVAPSSEWRWHFHNYKFWVNDHFLTSFQPTSLHCYFTFLLINDVRMTTFIHQLLSRKTSTPEVWQCECEYSSRSATCPSLSCAWAMQKSFSFNQMVS